MDTHKRDVTDEDQLMGVRIKEARDRLGVSQEKLGLACGTTRQNVQHWEAGRNFPPVSDLFWVIRMLRTDANHLFGQGPPKALTDEEKRSAVLEIETLARKRKQQKDGAEKPSAPRRRLRQPSKGTASARRAQ